MSRKTSEAIAAKLTDMVIP